MSLIRKQSPYSLAHDLPGLPRDIAQWMDSLWNKSDLASPTWASAFSPSAEVAETEQGYTLDVELPGMDEKDLQLDLRNNVLTIRGEKKSESKSNDKNWRKSERYYGSFRRDFSFDEEIDAEKVVAQLKKGVLHVELAKKDKAVCGHRKIEIKT